MTPATTLADAEARRSRAPTRIGSPMARPLKTYHCAPCNRDFVGHGPYARHRTVAHRSRRRPPLRAKTPRTLSPAALLRALVRAEVDDGLRTLLGALKRTA